MNKKAFAFYFFLELIAGIFAAYLLISIAVSWGKGDIFLQTKVARDVAIEINTLNTVPGNVYLQYPQNLSDFIVEFTDSKVEVYQKEDIKPSYEYLDSLNYLKGYKIDFLEFYKIKNKISFEKENE